MTKQDISKYIQPGMFLDKEAAETMVEFLVSINGNRLLEIGTGMGHSTRFLSALLPNWTVYTIDSFGIGGDHRIYQDFSNDKVKEVVGFLQGQGNVIQILGDSNRIPWELTIDALYIDGGHYYPTVKKDFDTYSHFVKENGVIFMHDYHREDFGVKRVVEEAQQQGWKLLHASKLAVLKR